MTFIKLTQWEERHGRADPINPISVWVKLSEISALRTGEPYEGEKTVLHINGSRLEVIETPEYILSLIEAEENRARAVA